jgi:hypothetical protein
MFTAIIILAIIFAFLLIAFVGHRLAQGIGDQFPGPPEDEERVCDFCSHQEDGRHYCLLHSKTVKNMDITTCADWEEVD